MIELSLISLTILIVTLHLSNVSFKRLIISGGGVTAENEVILMLTKDINKAKDYTKGPGNHQYFGFDVIGSPKIEGVEFQYKFPLIDKKEAVYTQVLLPQETVLAINAYGAEDTVLISKGDSYFINPSLSDSEKRSRLNKDGFYYLDSSNWGPDYQNIVGNARALTLPIAKFIEDELIKAGKDNYYNRVQAATNFVQHISYGLPDFDAPGNCYVGIAIPHESFFMNYSDCDSKSMLFGSILDHLLPPHSVVLISCLVASNNTNNAGHHMMAGVKGLNVGGERITFEGEVYTLIETTAPSKIGERTWDSIEINQIKRLS